MFNADFYPTPEATILEMVAGFDLSGKVIFDPSGGKGNIVDFAKQHGAKDVISCEINEDLKKILQTKCKVIASDFLTVTSEQVSHIDFIIMNPPFSADEKHILHAYEIAPPGCNIISLCNKQTIKNTYTKARQELKAIIEGYGTATDLNQCFAEAERKTNVEISLIKLQKPGSNYNAEFEGFFLDEEPEEAGSIGVMPYNVVRDLVNRYVAAVKLYDEQLNTGAKMNSLLDGFYGKSLAFNCTEQGKPMLRNEFKKELQKSGWEFIFQKMDLAKHTTRGLREDINKFVEQQTQIPFTMKNIYRMLDIVLQTTGQRMDKAILEAFDRVTAHHHDNRHNIKGWKTNSHFLVGKKFVLPNMVSPAKEYGYTSNCYTSLKSSYDGTIPDFEKALCYVMGKNYEETNTVNSSINRNSYGEWYKSDFFRYKAYKNGNMHFEFVDEKVWKEFNERVAKLKGYPLYEGKEQTAYQKRQTGRAAEPKTKVKTTNTQPVNVLFKVAI